MEITVNRLQELVACESGLSLQISGGVATLHFADSRSSKPDLNLVVIERQENLYVEILSGVNDGYNFHWVPNRKMNPKLKFLLFKLIR